MSRHTFISTKEQHPGHRSVAGGLARAAVFGISDGLVSNVSLVIGFASSGVDASVVRLAGIAGAIAGAASMAAGEWVSVSAQNELITRELEIERRELRINTAAETVELAKIYESHGIEPERAALAAADVMRRPDVALGVHAREELGVDPGVLPSPMGAALLSLACFLFGALVPVVPWYIGSGGAAQIASILIGVGFAGIVGALIGRGAERNVPLSALRQVLILLGACGVTYLIGQLFDVSVA
ncbi:MAG: VIT1/CCC1 transporter family protein [Actinomycetota bacterium]